MTTKVRLHQLVDDLPESVLPEAERLLDALRNGDAKLPRAFRQALWDDEPVTEDERAAVAEAYEDIARGDVVADADLDRELGW